MSILFTRSQAVQPLDALGYHIFTVYVCSKAFIVVVITFEKYWQKKKNKMVTLPVALRERESAREDGACRASHFDVYSLLQVRKK